MAEPAMKGATKAPDLDFASGPFGGSGRGATVFAAGASRRAAGRRRRQLAQTISRLRTLLASRSFSSRRSQAISALFHPPTGYDTHSRPAPARPATTSPPPPSDGRPSLSSSSTSPTPFAASPVLQEHQEGPDTLDTAAPYPRRRAAEHVSPARTAGRGTSRAANPALC